MKVKSDKNAPSIKKINAVIGIIVVVSHLTYYFLQPYNMWLFFIGFGVIWLLFLWLPKKIVQ